MHSKDNKNQPDQIYDKNLKTWFTVSHENYLKYDHWRTNRRKREQYHHRCMCPKSKWWLCDGMCDDCEFHASGDVLSLFSISPDGSNDEILILDRIINSESNQNEILLDQIMLRQILNRLGELMPEAFIIGMLRLQGLTDEAIADVIGIKRTTFRSRIEKVRHILHEEYGDGFYF